MALYGPNKRLLNQMLSKYAKMSETGPASIEPTTPGPGEPSSVWMSFAKAQLRKFVPSRVDAFINPQRTLAEMMSFLGVRASYFKTPGKGPSPTRVDKYISQCATTQYKQTACPNGVYAVCCTEGTTKLQAEDQRTLALGAEFRARQRSAIGQYAALFETRRHAIVQANMCGYEESLSVKYPASAAAVVRGYTEARSLCYRSSSPNAVAEKYMAGCIDTQYKQRAVPNGIYDVTCQDGAAKGLPEFKRVQALSATFRAGQTSKLQQTNLRYEAARYARANFAHMCSYEEDLFNRFPAVAVAMRPESSRY